MQVHYVSKYYLDHMYLKLFVGFENLVEKQGSFNHRRRFSFVRDDNGVDVYCREVYHESDSP